ncbi:MULTISPECIES: TolC family outer membrane protein [unclassified Achromobacter]|uniref:TolC family outer membrane protein n=1 Tax=unclassified Achromobacter TaxID=2626865 RepID=UPI001E4101D7|nr:MULTISPECIES: TolC family outer membrane protein [unclassified Achromobacter]
MTKNKKNTSTQQPVQAERRVALAPAMLAAIVGLAGCTGLPSAPPRSDPGKDYIGSRVESEQDADTVANAAQAGKAGDKQQASSGIKTASGELVMGGEPAAGDGVFKGASDTISNKPGSTPPLKPRAGEQLDSVPTKPAPRLDQTLVMPAPADIDPEKMKAYDSAKLPADGPLSLQQVFAMALDNDPTLRGAYGEMQAVGYGVTAARAALLPNVNVEANYARESQNVVKSENSVYQQGRASWGDNGYALTLTQPIYDPAAFQKWRQAQDTERKEVANFAYAQQDLMLRTATAYLSILAAQDQIELTEAERSMTRSQMELVQAKFRAGQVTQVGVSEVQGRLDVQDANYLLVKNDLFDKQQALQEIIGYGDVPLLPIRKDLRPVVPQPLNPDAWVQKSLEQNWSIRAAAAAVSVAEREVSVQKAGYLPSLNMKVSSGRNETGGSLFGGGSTVQDTRAQLNLIIPVFQGGYTYGMTHAAASRLGTAQTQLSLTRRKVQRQVLTSLQSILASVDRIKALGSSVQAFQQALDLKQAGYKSGLNDIVAVLDATRNLYNAKRQEAEARYNYLLDTLKLKQAAGVLSGMDIAAISSAVL